MFPNSLVRFSIDYHVKFLHFAYDVPSIGFACFTYRHSLAWVAVAQNFVLSFNKRRHFYLLISWGRNTIPDWYFLTKSSLFIYFFINKLSGFY